jgi:predicted TIM-barrel fold metal-dependent hydrolase
MKIDVYCHILTPKYFELLQSKAKPGFNFSREKNNLANVDLNVRLRLLDRYPDVLEVLTLSSPPLESACSASDAVELAKVGNDELAELCVHYPDKFVGAIACLPLNDMDATLLEVDRVITQLRFKGVQIYSNINGDTLDNPKFKPLWEKMVKYDLPIWIHPYKDASGGESIFGWPFETSNAMLKLVTGGVMRDYPDIKFVIHHAGAMAPFFEQRINWLYPLEYGSKTGITNPREQFKKFYCDTAVYGSTSALMCAYNFYGSDHILFGTDTPLGPRFGLTAETIRSIELMNISEVEKEEIYERNAVNLLKIAL